MSEETIEQIVNKNQEEESQADHDEALLIEFLRDHEERCPVCDYNLKMLTKAQCPECGRKLTLSVGTSEPYMRPWIVLMVAASGSSGLGLFWCLAILQGGLPPDNIIFPVFAQILMIPVTISMIIYRRFFFKIKAEKQRIIAWLGAIASVILFTWMVLLLFG